MKRKPTLTPRNNKGQFTGNYSQQTAVNTINALVDYYIKNYECWDCGKVYDATNAEKCPHCGVDVTPF